MLYNSSSLNTWYFIWPDINYFPANSREDEDTFWRQFGNIMSWIVTPVISLIGLLGNMTNIVILIREKVNKSSRCLILALAVADTLYIVGTNNVTIHLYARGQRFGFEYPEQQAQALFYAYLTQWTLELCSKVATLMLPFLITLDRMVAVLAPYQYSRIMTVSRVRLVIGALIVISASYAFIPNSKCVFKYVLEPNLSISLVNQPDNNRNTYSGIIAKSNLFLNHEYQMTALAKIAKTFYGPTPLVLTIIGCLIVGLKVKLIELKRVSLFASFTLKAKVQCFNRFFAISYFSKAAPKEALHRKQHNKIVVNSTSMQFINTGHISNSGVEHVEFTSCTNENREKKSGSIKGANISTELHTHLEPISENSESHVPEPNSKNSQAHVPEPNSKNSQKYVSKYGMEKVTRLRQMRTTRALLSVCGVYCIANTINYIVVSYFDQTNVDSDTAIGLETSRKFVLVLNSSCNFLFYVGLNSNFRESYRKLFGLCFQCRRRRIPVGRYH